MQITLKLRLFVILSGCVLLSGCVQGPARDILEGTGLSPKSGSRSTGVKRITYENQLEKIDLKLLLDPEGRGKNCKDLATRQSNHFPFTTALEGPPPFFSFLNDPTDPEYTDVAELQCAFNAFYTYSDGDFLRYKHEQINKLANFKKSAGRGKLPELSELEKSSIYSGQYSFSGTVAERAASDLGLIIRRNSVQDQIIATSEKACTDFKIALNDRITKSNFALSSIASTLASLGAIFVDPATSRGLSGASAIVSGINSSYNESYLQSLTVKVITAGIDLKRSRILEEINGHRFGSAISSEYFNHNRESNVHPARKPYISLSPYDRYVEERITENIKQQDYLQDRKFVIENELADAKIFKNTMENELELLTKERSQKINDQDQAQLEGAPSNNNLIQEEIEKKMASQRNNIAKNEKDISLLESHLKLIDERIVRTKKTNRRVPKNDRVGLVPLSQYSVELAVADAMRFHGACTIPGGLEEASQSVSEIRNPGVETMQRALDNINEVQRKIIDHNKLLRQEELDSLDHNKKRKERS